MSGTACRLKTPDILWPLVSRSAIRDEGERTGARPAGRAAATMWPREWASGRVRAAQALWPCGFGRVLDWPIRLVRFGWNGLFPRMARVETRAPTPRSEARRRAPAPDCDRLTAARVCWRGFVRRRPALGGPAAVSETRAIWAAGVLATVGASGRRDVAAGSGCWAPRLSQAPSVCARSHSALGFFSLGTREP